MIITYDMKNENYERFELFETEKYKVYYQGIFFIRGYMAGEESIKEMLKQYVLEGKLNFKGFYGAYLLMIYDKEKKEWVFFSDNSTLRSFYIGKTMISDSLLDLVKVEPEIRFSPEGMSQFISIGYVLFGKTVLDEVYTSDRDKYYVISKAKVSSYDKGIGGIEGESEIRDVELFFEDVAHALKNEQVTFDVTGGFDSRLVLSEMYQGLPSAEVCISGPKEHPDVIVGSKVAAALGKQIIHFQPDVEAVTEENILGVLKYMQCTEKFIVGYREWKLAEDRRNRGKTVRVTGDGGVLHKDWDWIQDFPFYRKRIKNKEKFLGKYYRQRVEIVNAQMQGWNKNIRQAYEKQRDLFVNRCMDFCQKTNTETYDTIYYYFSAAHHYCRYNTQAMYVNGYAPLMEFEYVKYSYHLPRIQRFYNNDMRKSIDRCNHDVAKIRTIYGTRCTGSFVSRVMDVPFYLLHQLKRLKRLLTRIFMNQNKHKDVERWNPMEYLRTSKLLKDAVLFGKRVGLLADNFDINCADKKDIESLISFYYLSLERGEDISVLPE